MDVVVAKRKSAVESDVEVVKHPGEITRREKKTTHNDRIISIEFHLMSTFWI